MANTDWTKKYAKTGWAGRAERKARAKSIRTNLNAAVKKLNGRSDENFRISGLGGRTSFTNLES
jgi:hypothetical protein